MRNSKFICVVFVDDVPDNAYLASSMTEAKLAIAHFQSIYEDQLCSSSSSFEFVIYRLVEA